MSLAFFIGAVGNLLFGFKSLFQVVHCHKTKSTEGLSLGMLLADFGGNLSCSYYIHHTVGFTVWLQFVNYGLATLWLIILMIMVLVYRR